jgi:hypothetical protein
MSRQVPSQPTRGYPLRGNAPPRAARHRSSVIGPPPGIEAGTGYQSPTRESFGFPRPPPPPPPPPPPQPTSSSSIGTSSRGRPDPNVFDPIYEEPPTPPRRSSRRGSRSRGGRESTGTDQQPTMMFYPSTTTVSSMSSDSFVEPPMPFFRTDPLQVRSARGSDSTRSLPPMEEEDPRRRTVSTVSSGVLGPGTIEVDPDTEEESDSDMSSLGSSGEGGLVRNVSMVRRGQARIIRNPSARRSTVPEVHTFFY